MDEDFFQRVTSDIIIATIYKVSKKKIIYYNYNPLKRSEKKK